MDYWRRGGGEGDALSIFLGFAIAGSVELASKGRMMSRRLQPPPPPKKKREKEGGVEGDSSCGPKTPARYTRL